MCKDPGHAKVNIFIWPVRFEILASSLGLFSLGRFLFKKKPENQLEFTPANPFYHRLLRLRLLTSIPCDKCGMDVIGTL